MKRRLSSLMVTALFLIGTVGAISPAAADRDGRGSHRSEDGFVRGQRGRVRDFENDRPRRRDHEELRYREERLPRGRGRGGRGLDAAIERLREETGARILSTERYGGDGRDTYRIRILTPEGRVRRLLIDGESGRLLRRQR